MGMALGQALCDTGSVTYDLSTLDKLGEEYEQIQTRLKDLRADLHREVLAAHNAGVQQVQIVKASRYTREAVRTIIRGADVD